MDADSSSTDAPACPGCAARDRRIAQLEARIAALEVQVQRLSAQLQDALRLSKRQAAPFSKGAPKANPKTPGRKAGTCYGPKAYRPLPTAPPDEVIDVPLPAHCPHCGAAGRVVEDRLAHQHQVEIPRRPLHRRFDLHLGYCVGCGRRVQPRHPLQTSDALGCCASQLGPQAQAAVVELNKTCGLSHGKVRRVLGSLFGLKLSRGGSAQVMLRAGRRCTPLYQRIVAALPRQASLTGDETGWRIGGTLAWLHVLTNTRLTCYAIDRERGFTVTARLLGKDYAGRLVHDGWAPYDRFYQARHQTCLAHLLRRCREMLEEAVGGAVRFPRQVQELLQKALRLRDRYAAEQISCHGLASARGRLQGRLDRLLTWTRSHPPNERLAKHLAKHRGQLFTFLDDPDFGLEATNWRGEQALRPAVVNRKVWGGNRTAAGADAQSVLMSVLRTAEQQGRTVIEFLSFVLRGGRLRLALQPAGP
jgi:transposase